jgi:hypothetical protein
MSIDDQQQQQQAVADGTTGVEAGDGIVERLLNLPVAALLALATVIGLCCAFLVVCTCRLVMQPNRGKGGPRYSRSPTRSSVRASALLDDDDDDESEEEEEEEEEDDDDEEDDEEDDDYDHAEQTSSRRATTLPAIYKTAAGASAIDIPLAGIFNMPELIAAVVHLGSTTVDADISAATIKIHYVMAPGERPRKITRSTSFTDLCKASGLVVTPNKHASVDSSASIESRAEAMD